MSAHLARPALFRVAVVAIVLSSATSWADAQDRLSNSAAIDAYLSGVVRDTRIPGIVALVTDADRIVYTGAFGHQDVAGGVPMANDTIFRIASMTKPVTSAAVMMLVQEGDIGLDDPVSDYLPAFEEQSVIESFNLQDKSYTTRPVATPVTIRHLLTHTSGLGYPFSNHTLAALVGAAPGQSVTHLPLLHDPGTRWTYGESTRVLGTLVEEVSGQPLDEFLSERIFVPLGMSDTFYTVPAPKVSRVVTVHRTTADGLVETPNTAPITAPVYGDGGLHSTAADYAKFIQLFLNNGRAPNGMRLLSEATVALMGENHIGAVFVEQQPGALPALSEPFPLGAGRDKFGLGFQITGPHDDPFARSAGSMSWAGIFNTEFWIDPQRGIGGVLLMQYLPFYDGAAISTLQGFERRVYEGLAD
jgi:CubicO group peptidase (beta-lactamase class C family)